MGSILSQQFREKVSKLKDYSMKQEAETNVSYSTGFLNFDFMNGTVIHVKSEKRNFNYYSVGIPDGCMCMLIGRSGCGKTTMAVQMGANICRPFKTSTFFHDDIEGGITATRAEMLTGWAGDEFNDRYIRRNSGINIENVYERIKMIHDIKIDNKDSYEYDTGLYNEHGERIFKFEPTVYLIDSLALLMPEDLTDEEKMSGSMSATATAKMNSMMTKRLVPLIKESNIILIFINHINKKIEIGPVHSKAQVSYLKQDESLPGGNTPIYLSNLMIRFDDGAKLKEEDTFGVNGSMVDLSLIKSRNNRAGQSVPMVFDQKNGFDPELSLFVMLKACGFVRGAGAYLYLGDRDDMKFSQKQFKSKLAEPEFWNLFSEQCTIMLKAMLDSTESDIQQEARITTNNAMLSMLESMNSDALLAA